MKNISSVVVESTNPKQKRLEFSNLKELLRFLCNTVDERYQIQVLNWYYSCVYLGPHGPLVIIEGPDTHTWTLEVD